MDKGNKGLYTMLGEGTVFQGTINVPHSMRIDGEFKGKITISEMLTIGNDGIVEAEISAKSALIAGKVTGNVTVEDRLELESNAVLIGNLKASDLVINEGALFDGNCSMKPIKLSAVKESGAVRM